MYFFLLEKNTLLSLLFIKYKSMTNNKVIKYFISKKDNIKKNTRIYLILFWLGNSSINKGILYGVKL